MADFCSMQFSCQGILSIVFNLPLMRLPWFRQYQAKIKYNESNVNTFYAGNFTAGSANCCMLSKLLCSKLWKLSPGRFFLNPVWEW
jgi:hypothetical protein